MRRDKMSGSGPLGSAHSARLRDTNSEHFRWLRLRHSAVWMLEQADAQGSLPLSALRGPKWLLCGGIERRITRDWDAWSDGLELVGASRDDGWAGRVAGCHHRRGRQSSVE